MGCSWALLDALFRRALVLLDEAHLAPAFAALFLCCTGRPCFTRYPMYVSLVGSLCNLRPPGGRREKVEGPGRPCGVVDAMSVSGMAISARPSGAPIRSSAGVAPGGTRRAAPSRRVPRSRSPRKPPGTARRARSLAPGRPGREGELGEAVAGAEAYRSRHGRGGRGGVCRRRMRPCRWLLRARVMRAGWAGVKVTSGRGGPRGVASHFAMLTSSSILQWHPGAELGESVPPCAGSGSGTKRPRPQPAPAPSARGPATAVRQATVRCVAGKCARWRGRR